MTDLVGSVLAACDAYGNAPALSSGRRTLGYRELGRRIRSTASALIARGLASGDRVLFSVRPGPDAVVLALAIVGAGGTVVFADPGAGEALFRARAALAAPRWVAAESLLYLASSAPLRPLARRRGLELAPYARLVPDAAHLRSGPWLPGVPSGAVPLARLALGEATALPAVDPEQDALVIFTSGTTGAPKAVVHGRLSLGAGLADFAAATGLRAGQRVLTDQLMIGVPALIAGAHWRIPAAGLDPGARPARYLAALPEAEALFASPATLDALLTAIEAEPALAPRRLHTLIIGGAPVLRPLLERAFHLLPGVVVRAVYGMTEILPVAIADGAEKLTLPAEAPGDFVGRLTPSVTARLDDGELVLAGAGLARGFLAELPDHPLTEVRTGDLARLDGGRLTLLGRRKDMLIRGTQNVYPGLYEPVMAGIPGVADVAMVGVPDTIGDDRIVVAVVPAQHPPAAPDAAHPLARAVARALPGLIDHGCLPDAVLAVPGFPRAGRNKKLDRAALAAQLAAAL